MGRIKKDSLGDRQKQYESVNDRILVPKMPFIIRVDGNAFHTYTRGFVKPFDEIMCNTMIEVTRKLCEEIPGAVIGYTQSDEITIVCKYTDRIKSQAWFNGRIRKIETIAASKTTKQFNKFFSEKVQEYIENFEGAEEYKHTLKMFYNKKIGMAEFDARVFNVPEWDCINNIIWRQQDAIRNSIEAVGHANFSTKELHKVNCDGIKEMLITEKGIDWENDFTPYQKYGALCYKVAEEKKIKGNKVMRSVWHIDENSAKIIQENRTWFSGVTGLYEE